jgi:hypothetical protein
VSGDVLEILGTSISSQVNLDATIQNHSGVDYSSEISYSLNTTINNLNPDGWKYAKRIIINSDNKNNKIYGLQAGEDKEVKELINGGSLDFSVFHNSAKASIGNNVFCGAKRNLKVVPHGVLQVEYNIEEGFWRIISISW